MFRIIAKDDRARLITRKSDLKYFTPNLVKIYENEGWRIPLGFPGGSGNKK